MHLDGGKATTSEGVRDGGIYAVFRSVQPRTCSIENGLNEVPTNGLRLMVADLVMLNPKTQLFPPPPNPIKTPR